MSTSKLPASADLARKIIERDLHHDLVIQELGCTAEELKEAWKIVEDYHANGRIKFWVESE